MLNLRVKPGDESAIDAQVEWQRANGTRILEISKSSGDLGNSSLQLRLPADQLSKIP